MSPNIEHQDKSEELEAGEELKRQKASDFVWTVIFILVGIILTTITLSNWKELLSLLGF